MNASKFLKVRGKFLLFQLRNSSPDIKWKKILKSTAYCLPHSAGIVLLKSLCDRTLLIPFFCVHEITTTDLCINALIFMKVVDIYTVLV